MRMTKNIDETSGISKNLQGEKIFFLFWKILFIFEKFFCIPCISVETFKMVKIERNTNTEYTSRTRKVILNLITKENL